MPYDTYHLVRRDELVLRYGMTTNLIAWNQDFIYLIPCDYVIFSFFHSSPVLISCP